MSAPYAEMDGETWREMAAARGSDDVVGILLQHHARIRALFSEVRGAQGDRRKDAFNELRGLLALHETAEAMMVRPAAEDTAGRERAEARDWEEREASKVLAQLEKMDISSSEFTVRFAQFEQPVLTHMRHEEVEEFLALGFRCAAEERQAMGRRLLMAEKMMPSRPDSGVSGSRVPQWPLGPFPSLLEHARDAFSPVWG